MSGAELTLAAVERLAKSLAFVANRTGMTVEKCEHVTDDAAATLRALSARVAELEGELATARGSALEEAARAALRACGPRVGTGSTYLTGTNMDAARAIRAMKGGT